jgi:hypothetical protein
MPSNDGAGKGRCRINRWKKKIRDQLMKNDLDFKRDALEELKPEPGVDAAEIGKRKNSSDLLLLFGPFDILLTQETRILRRGLHCSITRTGHGDARLIDAARRSVPRKSR